MKLAGWLTRLVLGTIVIVALTLFTTWNMVNLYIQQVLNEFNLPVEHEVSLGEVLTTTAKQLEQWIGPGGSQVRLAVEPGEVDIGSIDASEADDNNQTDASDADDPQNDSDDEATSASDVSTDERLAPSRETTSEPQQQESIAEEAEQETEDPFNQEAVEVWSQVEEQESVQDQIILSPEDFNQKKDQMSGEDKMRIFSLVMTKVPAEEIQKLSLYLEEGLTQEETQDIKSIIKAYLQEDDLNELVAILEKYK